jgi:hypothetical protein
MRGYKKLYMTMRHKLIMRQAQKKSKLWSHYYMEQQAQEAYNLRIFQKFQWQLRHTTRLRADEVKEDRIYKVYAQPQRSINESRHRNSKKIGSYAVIS